MPPSPLTALTPSSSLSPLSSSSRQTRSSTLPSQKPDPPSPDKRRTSKHRHHASHSHRRGQSHALPHPFSHSSHTSERPSISLTTSSLSPLGELLNPVRNVAEGIGRDLSGLAGRASRDRSPEKKEKDRDRDRSRSHRPSIDGDTERHRGAAEKKKKKDERTQADIERERRKLARAETVLREKYNTLAAGVLEQHKALADSRAGMLGDTLPKVEDTLRGLREVLEDTRGYLEALKGETIPGVTKEAEEQIQTLTEVVGKMERQRVQVLQKRVEGARAKVGGLGERMEKARRRVKGWEQREEEQARRRRRRVGLFWATLGVVLIAMIIVVVVGRVSDSVKELGTGTAGMNWTNEAIDNLKVEGGNWTARRKAEEMLRDVEEASGGNGGSRAEERKMVIEIESQMRSMTDPIDDDGRLDRIFKDF